MSAAALGDLGLTGSLENYGGGVPRFGDVCVGKDVRGQDVGGLDC